MGSDFTYSDLISRSGEEFEYELVGIAKVDGEECYHIRKQGKSRSVQRRYGYALEEHFFRKSDLVAIRIVFYDMAGDLLKEFRVREVAELGPYRYPSHVVMTNLQSGHSSEIVFDSIESPDDLPDEHFTHRYLQGQ